MSEKGNRRFFKGKTELDALLRVLPDLMFILDKDGIFLDYHGPLQGPLLVPPEKFIKHNYREILPKETSDKFDQSIKRVLSSDQPQSFDYSLMIKGEKRYFEARLIRYGREKILSIIKDITDREEVAEALRETNEKYKQLVEYAPTGIWEIDYLNQKIVSVNDILCEYLGFSREEILAGNPLDFITPESQQHYLERLQRIASSQPLPNVFELQIKTRKGTPIWTLMNTREIYENGRLKGAYVIAQDITVECHDIVDAFKCQDIVDTQRINVICN
jgi:PAS domain S-box-containing protein